jgi:hypothetical protein
MLMPFAALGNFEPVSTAVGAAFWGTFAAVVFFLITVKVNKKLVPFTIAILLFWYPLLETSRWAWNPNLIPVWIALGLWCYFQKSKIGYFFTGIFLALTFHNHFIALFSTAPFIGLAAIDLLTQKRVKEMLLLGIGFILPFTAFILFDLRHPPGLFFSHYFMQGNTVNTKAIIFTHIFSDFFNAYTMFSLYITQNNILAICTGILLPLLLIFDIKFTRKALLFVLPVIGQLLCGLFVDGMHTRYLIPALGFLFVWLIYPRERVSASLSKGIILILITGALLSVYPQIHAKNTIPNVSTMAQIDKIIIETIHKNHIENANIASLASQNQDTLATNFRDALMVYDVKFLASSQYDVSAHLFVITTASEKTLRKDEAYPMTQFKNAELGGVYQK